MMVLNDEEKILLQNILLEKNVLCEKCGGKTRITQLRSNWFFRCTWSKCRTIKTVWNNTLFYNFKTKPEKILVIAKLWFNGVSKKKY